MNDESRLRNIRGVSLQTRKKTQKRTAPRSHTVNSKKKRGVMSALMEFDAKGFKEFFAQPRQMGTKIHRVGTLGPRKTMMEERTAERTGGEG